MCEYFVMYLHAGTHIRYTIDNIHVYHVAVVYIICTHAWCACTVDLYNYLVMVCFREDFKAIITQLRKSGSLNGLPMDIIVKKVHVNTCRYMYNTYTHVQ